MEKLVEKVREIIRREMREIIEGVDFCDQLDEIIVGQLRVCKADLVVKNGHVCMEFLTENYDRQLTVPILPDLSFYAEEKTRIPENYEILRNWLEEARRSLEEPS